MIPSGFVFAFAVYTIKSAAILSVARVATLALRRASAAARHAVWCGAIVCVLLLPLATTVTPVLTVKTSWIPASLDGGPRARASSAESSFGNAARIAGPPIGMVVAPPSRFGFDWPDAAALLWAFGVSIVVLRAARGLLRTRELIRYAEPATLPVLDRMSAHGGNSVGLLVSDHIESPVVVGIVRPTILVPRHATRWDPQTAQSVLAHERAHVDRRDCLTQLLALVVCAVHWFNPLAWLAARSLALEAERACDDAALRDGAAALSYAELLLGFARAAGAGKASALVMPMARSGKDLGRRVEAVLDPLVSRRRQSIMERTSVVAAGSLVLVPLAALQLGSAPVLRSGPQASGEPDRRADSVSSPSSERIALSDDVWRAARNNVPALLSGPDARFAARLSAALDHTPTFDGDLVAKRAAWALSVARGDRLVKPLIDHLADPDWRVQAFAAWALSNAGDARAVLPLVQLLSHPVWRVRAMGATALATLGDLRARSAMLIAISDPAWQVRVEAVRLLARADDPLARSAVTTALQDRHVAVRLAADSALTANGLRSSK